MIHGTYSVKSNFIGFYNFVWDTLSFYFIFQNSIILATGRFQLLISLEE